MGQCPVGSPPKPGRFPRSHGERGPPGLGPFNGRCAAFTVFEDCAPVPFRPSKPSPMKGAGSLGRLGVRAWGGGVPCSDPAEVGNGHHAAVPVPKRRTVGFTEWFIGLQLRSGPTPPIPVCFDRPLSYNAEGCGWRPSLSAAAHTRPRPRADSPWRGRVRRANGAGPAPRIHVEPPPGTRRAHSEAGVCEPNGQSLVATSVPSPSGATEQGRFRTDRRPAVAGCLVSISNPSR